MLPHESILDDKLDEVTPEETNRIVEVIQTFRSSHATIKLAHLINLLLTFLFGYRFMASIFNLFNETEGTGLIFAGVLAGIALIALFDLPYHAWNAISQRSGLSTEQMATADTAAKYSLYGSLASSIAAIVLSQNLIELPQSLTFIATGAGLIAVAFIAIMHMQWWHNFNKESFDAKQRAEIASHTATKLGNQIKHEKEIAALEARRLEQEHRLRIQQLQTEQELEIEKLTAEAEIRKEFLQHRINQKKAVAQQVATKWRSKVNEVSDKIVEKEADQMVQSFLTDYGLSANGATNGANNRPNSS